MYQTEIANVYMTIPNVQFLFILTNTNFYYLKFFSKKAAPGFWEPLKVAYIFLLEGLRNGPKGAEWAG